jgi:hypothetical protein
MSIWKVYNDGALEKYSNGTAYKERNGDHWNRVVAPADKFLGTQFNGREYGFAFVELTDEEEAIGSTKR